MIRHLTSTDSTNREARVWATEMGADRAPDGAVVVADHQTAGRGRFERTWISSPGRNLLLTVILRRTLPRPALLPLAAGVAVREAAASFLPGRTVGLKWPNDVWVAGEKLAGILVESPQEGLYLVGIGLNVNEDRFPDGLPTEPTSLLLASGQHTDRAEVFDRLMRTLDTCLDHLENGTLLDAYRPHLIGHGQTVTLEDGRTGKIEGVDDDGGLILNMESGRIVVHSGDVSLRSPAT
ncbi:MAG: biotin--[acetyl-CoA-carboxylase] ligase [Bacteroidota bacterium]|nr:biotin--[acetyl-CoA-carboxylase] ligase [Bacteroidota bacterium]